MSDNWITLIPKDPQHVPDSVRRVRARNRFAEIAPDSDQIEIKVSDQIAFFDCGSNFERVCCSSCGAEVLSEWWQERMDRDYSDGGFQLIQFAMPCCHAKLTLDDLSYEWPQGFARFALDAMNPSIGKLNEEYKIEFEEILATRLRVIYQHT